MRIGIHATSLLRRQPTGIGIYARELLQALVTISHNSHQYWVLPRSLRRSRFTFDVPAVESCNVQRVLHPDTSHPVLDQWLEQVTLPMYLSYLNLDVYHSFRDFRLPKSRHAKRVLTVHDLLRFRRGEWYSFSGEELERQRSMVSRGLHRADVIVAVSQSTADDIVQLFNIEEGKVRVIHSGVSKDRRVMKEGLARKLLSGRLGLSRPFLLGVGTGRRKNPSTVIRAYASLRDRRNLDHRLVFVGSERECLSETARRCGVHNNINYLGYVPEGLMTALYNCASVVVYPSWYEGFGLPILESMACGTPVVTSSRSAMPEVAGDAAIVVDPGSVSDIADGIWKILTNGRFRQRLVNRGIARVQRFSWVRTARQVLEVYGSVG